MKTLILSLLLSCSASLFAGDAATLYFHGFSSDGKYLAFEQFGIADGAGEAYAELHVLDVAKNAYAVPLFSQPTSGENATAASSEQAESEEQVIALVRQANLQAAKADMERLKLQETQSGQLVIDHPLHDLSADPLQVRFAPQLPLAGHAYDEFILDLQETEVEEKCYGALKGKRFSLTIRTKDQSLAQATTLQADQHLPKSRGCPLAYRIAQVYVYQEKYLAVLLNMLLPGFEGQDMRYLVVTGVLPTRTEAEGLERMSDAAQQKRAAIFQQAVERVEQSKAAMQQEKSSSVSPKDHTPASKDAAHE